MRILFALVLMAAVPGWATELARPTQEHQAPPPQALAPQTVVAQTTWPTTRRITLLRDTCGWPGGARRAQEILPYTRQIRWGCWGYNETGVQVQWSTGRTDHLDFLDLYIAQDGWWRQMGYQRLHDRLWHLDNTP